MAEGGEFSYKDAALDYKLDNDDDKDTTNTPTNTSQGFEPITFSTPYHRGEQNEMQTMQHEQSGLPSYDERTTLLTADIERRLSALREDPLTGIINPLSEEDRKKKKIQKVKKLIKDEYPKADVDKLMIRFSQKNPMDIVVLGPKLGETKIVKNDGSGLQKSFLNLSYVKKVLGPEARQIAFQQRVDLNARKKELEAQEANYRTDQQLYKQIDAEMKDIGGKIDKKEAKVAQLKEVGGNEEKVKREEQVLKNLKKDFTDKQKNTEVFQKKISKNCKRKTSTTTNHF